ncbi:ferritin-like domain-containing protein [Geodermatophilus sp. SYSU D00705]
MADDGVLDEGTETTALREALAAEHAAVWGYGSVGAGLPPQSRPQASVAENAHRDVRDRLGELLEERGDDPVPAEAGYALPFPVVSPVDAAALAVVLEDGVAAAWVRVLDQAVQSTVRRLAVDELGAAEVRAVSWRGAAAQTPVTTAFPGLPEG